jgi:hypothetical protein
LDPGEDSVDARAATAHAAATLWSLCVDMEHIKPLVAQEVRVYVCVCLYMCMYVCIPELCGHFAWIRHVV